MLWATTCVIHQSKITKPILGRFQRVGVGLREKLLKCFSLTFTLHMPWYWLKQNPPISELSRQHQDHLSLVSRDNISTTTTTRDDINTAGQQRELWKTVWEVLLDFPPRSDLQFIIILRFVLPQKYTLLHYTFSHHQQGRIDFNTVNPSLSTGKDFLIHSLKKE